DREHGRPGLRRDRVPALLEVVEEHDRPPWRVDLLAVDGERRVAANDDVHLFVDELRVVLDHLVARVRRRVRVDAERRDPERLPDRLPHERAEDGQPLDVVDAQRLHPYVSSVRSSSSRSSRFAGTSTHATSGRESAAFTSAAVDARTTTGVPSSNARRIAWASISSSTRASATSTSPSRASSGTRLPVAPNQRSLISRSTAPARGPRRSRRARASAA